MEEEKTSNVIKWPIENRRANMDNIPTEPEEIVEKIQLMKKAYFSEVADHMLDDVLRSIDQLDLELSKYETFPMSSNDIIMIKESIIASMCRVVGIEHPLHAIGESELLPMYNDDFDDVIVHGYKFKSEVESEKSKLPQEV